MTRPGVESRRKAVHVGMAGFALLLPSLGVAGSAGAALVALLFNLVLLPRLAGDSLSRPADLGRRVPVGIVTYPVTVLLLVLLFAPRLELAAAGWGYLAFGDGLASVAGHALGGPRLPWNRAKSAFGSLAFLACGAAGAALLYGWCLGRVPTGLEVLALAAGSLAGAVVEGLPSELDDNLLPPVVGAAVLAGALAALPALPALASASFLRGALLALAVNAAAASLAVALRVVRPSGGAAGFLFGTLVLAFGSWPFYALLWTFFGAGTLLTRAGKRRKEAIGKAEEAGGRRGAANVLANVSVAAFCVAVAGLAARSDPLAAPPALHGPGLLAATWRLAAVAAFATALADTTGTEVGQALRTPTFLLPDFRPAPPGTDGAVSVAGTLAALLAAAAVGGVALALGLLAPFPPRAALLAVVAAAFLGSTAESLLQREGASWKVTNGHVLNFFNTLAGAGAAALLSRLLA